MRKKLKPYGIEIETFWGVGYAMSEACKMRARQLMAA
jgi:hypothetical protein